MPVGRRAPARTRSFEIAPRSGKIRLVKPPRMEERSAPANPNRESEEEVQRDLEWHVAESTGDGGHVVIHNDDVTPYDFVIAVLRAVFRLAPPDAERVTWEAHTQGQAHVITLGFEEAKYRVGKAHGIARQAGYPLSFTIEAE